MIQFGEMSNEKKVSKLFIKLRERKKERKVSKLFILWVTDQDVTHFNVMRLRIKKKKKRFFFILWYYFAKLYGLLKATMCFYVSA